MKLTKVTKVLIAFKQIRIIDNNLNLLKPIVGCSSIPIIFKTELTTLNLTNLLIKS